MGFTIAQQAAALGGAVLLGLAVGALYDLFRVLRVRLRFRVLGAALDFLFWVVVTAALFVYALAAGDGEVRLSLLAGHFGGAVLYFLLVSPWLLKIGYAAADFCGLLWKIVTLPAAALRAVYKKMKKILKNIFLYWKKWFTIIAIPRELEAVKQAEGREGGAGNEAEKNRASHKDRGPGAAGGPHRHAAGAAGADRRGGGAEEGAGEPHLGPDPG